MNDDEDKALQAGAELYAALPGYLLQDDTKQHINHLLIDLIDALDDVEYSRTGQPFFDVLYGSVLGTRKRAILRIEKRYGLTEREKHILRYLANDRSPKYIANALGISPSTAKAHKYSIYKKLGIHSNEEFAQMLYNPEILSSLISDNNDIEEQ